MSLRVLISFVCFVSAPFLQAQYDDLLRDPDITWVAEYTTDFVMHPESEDERLSLNYFDLIQLKNVEDKNGLYGDTQKYLSQQFLKNASLEGFSCYKDSLLEKLMTQKEILSTMTEIDTIYGYWEGGNESMVIKNDVSFDQIRCFRIRQVFWYNQKSKAFNSRLMGYAPIVDTKDNEGSINGTRALFWLKADENLPKRFKSKRLSYIFQTKMKGNAPRFEDFKVLKGSFNFGKFFEKEIETPSRRCLDRVDYTPADMSVLRVECFGADTIVIFDPKAYEEQIQIVQRNCIEKIEKICFVQNWYYDEQRHRLYARLMGVAPLAAIRDSEGNLRFYKPLFYQMYR